MLKKRFKLNPVLMGTFAFFAILTLMPLSAHSIDIGDSGWVIDGFLRNNTGAWTENWDTSLNNDPLATCRNWFRLNLNGKFSQNVRLKVEVLAIYEPEYPRERHGTEGDGTPIAANEYNYFDFRELRLDWRVGSGHTLLFGRQIVNWGESISARVGDIINPVDGRFDLGFTNLEDTRMPVWMIRGLHTFRTKTRSIGLDWVWSPYMEPDRYRINRTPSNIGHTFTNGNFIPGTRFAAMPESLAHMERESGMPAYYDITQTLPAWVNLGVPGTDLPIIGAPWQNMWQPTGAGGQYFGYAPNPLDTDYPDSSLEDARWGFKLGTTFRGIQTGVYFWDQNTFDGSVFKITNIVQYFPIYGIPGGTFDIQLKNPREKIYGFFANKNFSFGVLRCDVAYHPDKDYNTLEQYDFDGLAGPATSGTGIVEKDLLKVQVGINKDMMIQKLNPNASFSFIGEYVGEYILDSDLDKIAIATYYIPVRKDLHTLMASLSTSYAMGKYAYALTVLHTLNYGGCGLIQPTFTFSPDWMNNKWRFTLQYSSIYGPDYSYVYGLLKQKDMVVFTTQFSF